ncbi:MAG: hypothetical protein KDB34_07195, partial [Propionibacteriaceae bacterium]|nr:hypothetical protein [Propionibacteriaceae bacterium]
RRGGLGARAADPQASFFGSDRRVVVDLGADARLDIGLDGLVRWPSHQPFGGSSWFQLIPGLNQYWHPWLLGGRASGTVLAGDHRWDFSDAQVYGEKNWGRAGFPDSWWWGQAQGFSEPDACGLRRRPGRRRTAAHRGDRARRTAARRPAAAAGKSGHLTGAGRRRR